MIECVSYLVFLTLFSLVLFPLWACLLFDSYFRAMEVFDRL
ncbi:MAG: hypothetical protein J07HN6_02334 [Halonotius sp. J07HN6]|nr:MAG: hypothetical protein J07HN6_02334 [Halonotius sp. J07HN6]